MAGTKAGARKAAKTRAAKAGRKTTKKTGAKRKPAAKRVAKGSKLVAKKQALVFTDGGPKRGTPIKMKCRIHKGKNSKGQMAYKAYCSGVAPKTKKAVADVKKAAQKIAADVRATPSWPVPGMPPGSGQGESESRRESVFPGTYAVDGLKRRKRRKARR